MLPSSTFTVEPTDTGRKSQPTREQRETGEDGNPVIKPALVHHYNMNMNGGITLINTSVTILSIERLSQWWKRAATHLLHMAKIQAMILYNKYEGKKISQS